MKPKFKPKMDFADIFLDQPTMNNIRGCKDEIIITIIAVEILFIIVGCSLWCIGRSSTKEIEKLQEKNRTLKKIIFSAMEAGILRMMHHDDPVQNLDED